jgi:hypothetical protein
MIQKEFKGQIIFEYESVNSGWFMKLIIKQKYWVLFQSTNVQGHMDKIEKDFEGELT